MPLLLLRICLLSLVFVGFQHSVSAQVLTAGKASSLRGLSVVNDSVAWASGSGGWVAHTRDKGKTWDWKQLTDYAKLDFRDIEAFSATTAVMVSAGTPAVILRTDDGGTTWKEAYRNAAPEIFLDGMDFWDEQRGIIYGDPIADKMQLLKTSDGGITWTDISSSLRIAMEKGEASFAASGTTIRTQKGGKVWIATGGSRSRIFYSADYGAHWEAFPCPIIQGGDSMGPFSIAFLDGKTGIAAGGDYKRDTLRTNTLVLTANGGKSWKSPLKGPGGYRSCVEYITKTTLVAVGTSGVDLSHDGGKTWEFFSSDSYNTVRRAKSGTWTLMAGSRGKITAIDPLQGH